MVQDLGAGGDDHTAGLVDALEVGGEDFYLASGGLAADFANDVDERLRGAEVVVIAIDAGDDGVAQAERGDGVGDALGFIQWSMGCGRPLGTAQKPQRRVQRLPSIMKVAVLWFQHSPMLGQWADSQTVCRPSSRVSFLSAWKVSPMGARAFSQTGFAMGLRGVRSICTRPVGASAWARGATY